MSDFPPIGNGLSINGDKLTVNPNFITAGSGISVTWNGQVYTVSATGGGGSGTVTNVATGTGLTGGPITTTGTLSLAPIANNTLLANTSGTSAAPASTTLTAGTWMDVTMSAGAITVSRRAANASQQWFSNPTGTASTSGVMMGLAGSFTPGRTGTIISGYLCTYGSNTAGGGAGVEFHYGTGTAPTNGASPTGTTAIGGLGGQAYGANIIAGSLSPSVVITGLTVGTTYWFDLKLFVFGTGGIASITDVQFWYVEL